VDTVSVRRGKGSGSCADKLRDHREGERVNNEYQNARRKIWDV
jgi:hypothetical protein